MTLNSSWILRHCFETPLWVHLVQYMLPFISHANDLALGIHWIVNKSADPDSHSINFNEPLFLHNN